MILGIIAGFGIGLTVATVIFTVLLIRANNRASKNGDTVEALLIRKAEAIERMADALEAKR